MHDCSPEPSTNDRYTTDDPNAFAHDGYLPVSPASATSIMGKFQDLDETICGMVYGLINTVHKCTLAHEIAKMEANSQIKEHNEEIVDLQVQLAQLEGSANAYEKLEGFSTNNGHIRKKQLFL
jgi:hypothetical protein